MIADGRDCCDRTSGGLAELVLWRLGGLVLRKLRIVLLWGQKSLVKARGHGFAGQDFAAVGVDTGYSRGHVSESCFGSGGLIIGQALGYSQAGLGGVLDKGFGTGLAEDGVVVLEGDFGLAEIQVDVA